MRYQLPVVDDTLVWDVFLSAYRLPAISVAIELGIFEALNLQSDTAKGLAQRLSFDTRGLTALLPMLAQLGFLRAHAGLFQLSEAGQQYMLKASPFYWGNVFARVGQSLMPHKNLLETINKDRENAEKSRPADGWESGHVDMEMAKVVTAFMHSHSMPAAVGMTHTCDFSLVKRVLDIGGGSGCFSIALAQAYPEIRCTVMELPTICTLASQYIASGEVSEQVDTLTVDMFREAWPQGYDAHFFSNVFHDWTLETCLALAKSSYQALAPGGQIVLHEMLLDDSCSAPDPAVTFSLLMAMGTMGQQFSFIQLQEILTQAGFKDVKAQSSYGYYSIVRATK